LLTFAKELSRSHLAAKNLRTIYVCWAAAKRLAAVFATPTFWPMFAQKCI